MKRLILNLVVIAGLGMQFAVGDSAAQHPPQIEADSVEHIRLNDGGLPSVNLTSELLYRILVAEIAAQRGELGIAATGFLSLARDTTDPRFARLAFRAAVILRDKNLAAQAAQQWAALSPDDPEAVASSLAMAASSGEVSGLAAALRQRIEQAEDKSAAVAQAAGIVSKLDDRSRALDVLDAAFDDSVLNLTIARLALSDAAWAADDAPRALNEALQALSLQPDLETAALRALEYGVKVDAPAAFSRAENYAASHPDSSHKLQILLANHKMRQHDFDGALAILAAMRERNPEDFDLLYTEAEINARAGRNVRAKKLLNEYISVQSQRRDAIDDQASTAMADASDARLLLVKIAEQENELDEAIRQLDLIDDPAVRFQAQIHKAVLLSRQGLLSQARKTIEGLAASDDREHAVKALTLSSIYREAGRTDQAIDTLIDADRRLPGIPEIKYDLGMLYERQGQFDAFEEMMQSVIELEPNNANAYNALGYTLVDRNTRLDEARDLLQRALELEPDSPYILDSVGWYFFRTQEYEDALMYLQRSYELMESAEVAAHLGEVLWKLDRRTEARQIWREGLGFERDNPALLETMRRYGVQP